MSHPVRVLCVLAIPGTGENLLSRLLSSMNGVRDHGELFDPSKPTARRDPGVTLDLATDLAAPDRVAITVFPGHVSRPLLAEHVLSRPDVAPIVVRRRVIDCYVARRELPAPVGGPARIGHRVAANIDDFERWAARNARWYRWCVDTISERVRGPEVLTFEREIEAGPAAVRGFIDATLSRRSTAPIEGDQADVRPTDAPNRIADWDAFEEQLEERGLLDLAMGYFV